MMLVPLSVAVLAACAGRVGPGPDTGTSSPRPPDMRTPAAVGTLFGTVRADPSGTPISGARVEWGAGNVVSKSDSAGRYTLRDVTAGSGALRISHEGYEPLALDVTVPVGAALRVDAVLGPKPALLATVDVRGTRADGGVQGVAQGADGDPLAWRWDANSPRASVLTGATDVFRTLSADPHVSMRGEPSSGVADRGGAPDETLVRLDGLPLWYPFHAAGVTSAVSPDAVSGLTLRDGAASAGEGEHLSGVLDVQTRASSLGGATWGSAIETPGVRASWLAPIGGGGSALVAVRHGYWGLVPDAVLAPGNAPDQWSDITATATLPAAAGTLHAVAFASGDQLAFTSPGLIPDSTARGVRRVAGWQSGTAGLVWSRPLGTAMLTARAWGARYHASEGLAGVGSGPLTRDALYQIGTSGALSWRSLTVGGSAELLDAQYQATPSQSMSQSALVGVGVGVGGAMQPLNERAHQPIVSAFVDQRWGPEDGSWRVVTGLRTSAAVGLTSPAVDPHVSGQFRLWPGLSLVAGYGRAHQYVQSLRNPESAAGAALGAEFPIAVGARGIPVASSDEVNGGVVADLAPRLRLTVDGYLRRLRGLVLTDPQSLSPAAVSVFDTGSGRAVGFAAQLEHFGNRFAWLATYGVGRTTRSVGGYTYHPSFELGQAATIAVGYRITPSTQLRLAGWTSTGRQVTVGGGILSPTSGPSGTPTGGYGESDGSGDGSAHVGDGGVGGMPGAGATGSTFGTGRVPLYARMDLGIVREWSVGGRSTPGRLSTYFSINNLLARHNTFAYVGGPGGTLRAVGLQPLSVSAGIAWHF